MKLQRYMPAMLDAWMRLICCLCVAIRPRQFLLSVSIGPCLPCVPVKTIESFRVPHFVGLFLCIQPYDENYFGCTDVAGEQQ